MQHTTVHENWVLAKLPLEQARALMALGTLSSLPVTGQTPPPPSKRQAKDRSGRAARRSSNSNKTVKAVGGRKNPIVAIYTADLGTVARDPEQDLGFYTRSPQNPGGNRAGKGA